ncbi:hypothetical protein [Sphingobium vermicomposti]|uniref:Uncharacterized protein n=1 Tax=Sphingobium vermicomposti TaxID=529005 RepID=A0A846MBC4_9SPHN|nr:hypothetical protein [Sphingobium vermicomposti]NIJ17930.1 hypothetical protein [Sphingobium vermicomposti]
MRDIIGAGNTRHHAKLITDNDFVRARVGGGDAIFRDNRMIAKGFRGIQ